MMKYLKNNKGFTLVEVIVVAVIVLVLAAVAIPLYQGYVTDARQASVDNAAGSIASALGAAFSTGAIGPSATEATMVDADDETAGSISFPAGSSNVADRVSITIPKRMTVTIANCVVTVTHSASSGMAGTANFCIPQ